LFSLKLKKKGAPSLQKYKNYVLFSIQILLIYALTPELRIFIFTMPNLRVFSVFTNVRVRNINTRIGSYSEPSIFTDVKVRDTISFFFT
jgi:hypothetical protein